MLEALWDGDTQGWFLELYLTDAEGRRNLLSLRYGSDTRLFDGQVPPWPEAEVACLVGEYLCAEHGFEFWFPNPGSPESDVPTFAERHGCEFCVDCKEPIKPDRGPFAPTGLCWGCSGAREARDRDEQLRKRLLEPPREGRKRGLAWFFSWVEEGRQMQQRGATSNAYSAKQRIELLTALLGEAPTFEEDIHLDTDATRRFGDLARRKLETLLEAYDPQACDFGARLRRPVLYRGREYLMSRFREADMMTLIDIVERSEKPAAALDFFTSAGLRVHEMHALEFARQREGSLDEESFRAALFTAFESTSTVDAVLDRLMVRACIERNDEGLRLTRKGWSVWTAEDAE